MNDLASASVYMMGLSKEIYEMHAHSGGGGQLNVGSGLEISIGKLAEMISEVVGFSGQIVFVQVCVMLMRTSQ